MAKARVSTNPIYQGGAGGFTFYSRGGEQIIRQRKNNSNYGASASRSVAQQTRRVKWANLVNVYKAMAYWQKKAYDSKKEGVTDYNTFMSLNIGSTDVCLTKELASNGCAVMEAYQISKGSLMPLTYGYEADPGALISGIVLSSTISSSSTIGALSSDIIANNAQFRDGDNIAFISFINKKDSRGFPYLTTNYYELTLDVASTQVISAANLFGGRINVDNEVLAINPLAASAGEVYFAMIHTRLENGNLKVSTQEALPSNADYLWDEYWVSAPGWLQECIDSYGVDVDVPLNPN